MTVKIIGTDIDRRAIDKAAAGVYPESGLEEVKKKHLDSCFEGVLNPHAGLTECEQLFRLKDELRQMVSLECDDVIGRLSSVRGRTSPYNLILCRNMLIYLNLSLQEKFLFNVTERLYEGGYLVLGASETLPQKVRSLYVQPFEAVKIYRKKSRTQKNVP